MLVEIEVCWSDLPMDSATDMKRLANSDSRIGSGPASCCLVALLAAILSFSMLRAAETDEQIVPFVVVARVESMSAEKAGVVFVDEGPKVTAE